jgi:hypothetical protein
MSAIKTPDQRKQNVLPGEKKTHGHFSGSICSGNVGGFSPPFRNNGRLSSPAGQKAGRDAKRSGGKIVTCVGGCVFMADLLRIDGGRKAAVPQLIIYSVK